MRASLLPRLVRQLASVACAGGLLALLPAVAAGAQLVAFLPVDEQVLMLHARDGEVFFRDNGEGPSAFTGHDYAEGDDRLVRYGEPLAVEAATRPGSWRIVSSDDPRYAAGTAPEAVHRKAKVFHTTHEWDYALEHWIFLRLPHPMQPGARYTVKIDAATGLDQREATLHFQLEHARSEAIHVNLTGYRADSPVKAADLYLWLGDGGARDYAAFVGRPVWLYEVANGTRHEVGEVRFWQPASRNDAFARNLTGSPVWTVDFSSFHRPGTYRLVVDGVGCSADFVIGDRVWFEPFKTALRGYYYMRVGERKDAAFPPPRQPRFIPDEDPPGFKVYLTDLHPFDPQWRARPGDTWDEPHFKPATESIFWARRLPGHPTNPHARGGRSDALDWDRHLSHVSDIYDILLPYLLSRGGLDDDHLAIAESGNGIPDLIDEARNEVDMWLSLRVGDAYAHGLTNPTRERTIMFQAGATTMAAWANAANCAMLAEAFRISGHGELMAYYRDEAIKAFAFASRQEWHQLDDTQDIGDTRMRGRDFRMMAGAFLFNVTGDTRWEDVMAADSVVRDGVAPLENDDQWVQTWAAAAYLLSPHPRRYPALAANLRSAIRQQAIERNVRHVDTRPSRRASTNRHWQTPHNLQLVALAHAFADDAAERARFLRAMVLEADWGLGRNPSNIVEMTGLGSRSIVNCYTSGRNDGVPGLHPGHTPYNNLEPWGGDHIGSNPRWFAERGYPDWDAGGWPHQEAHFNSRYSWANAEFTPRQTMRGKLVLYAYLEWLARAPTR
jgi:endoglucanase